MLPQQTIAFLARGTQFKTGCKKTADYADYADNNGLVMLYSQLSRICTIGPQPDALVSAVRFNGFVIVRLCPRGKHKSLLGSGSKPICYSPLRI